MQYSYYGIHDLKNQGMLGKTFTWIVDKVVDEDKTNCEAIVEWCHHFKNVLNSIKMKGFLYE